MRILPRLLAVLMAATVVPLAVLAIIVHTFGGGRAEELSATSLGYVAEAVQRDLEAYASEMERRGSPLGTDNAPESIASDTDLVRAWPAAARLFLLRPTLQGGPWEAPVPLAWEREGREVVPLAGDWRPADLTTLQSLNESISPAASGWRRAPWRGRDALWVHVPMGTDHVLLGILPRDALGLRAAALEGLVRDRSRDLLRSIAFVAAAAVIVALLAALVGARRITRPLRALSHMADQLALRNYGGHLGPQRPPEMAGLVRHFNAMGPKLENMKRMEDSLQVAMLVQRQLLPRAAPRLEGFDIAGRSVSCDETGGDYFDFVTLPSPAPHRVAVLIGDVAGHGVAAALIMATARATLRSLSTMGLPPDEVVTRFNERLSDDVRGDSFMTLLYLVLDSGDRSVRSVQAGHEPAIVWDPERGRFSELVGPTNVVAGIDPAWHYLESAPAVLPAGHLLIGGTDGVWECRDPSGTQFGQKRLRDVIREHSDEPADTIADAIIDAVDVHRGGRKRDDDVTLVVVKSLSCP